METYTFPRIIQLSHDCYNVVDNALASEWLQMSCSMVSLINKIIETVALDDMPHWAPVLDSIVGSSQGQPTTESLNNYRTRHEISNALLLNSQEKWWQYSGPEKVHTRGERCLQLCLAALPILISETTPYIT